MVGTWYRRVRWRLFATFGVLVFFGFVAWLLRSHLLLVGREVYDHLVGVSVLAGIAFCCLGVIHAHELKKKGLTPNGGRVLVKVFGPPIDPLLEAVGYALSFHTAASMLGQLFLYPILPAVALAERTVFGLALGGLMFWSLKKPAQQFVDTFWIRTGASATASLQGPEDNS